MKRVLLPLTALAMSAGFSASATAGDFNYNYLDIGVSQVDLDLHGHAFDGKGYGVNGSFDIADHWHIHGGFNHASFDTNLKTSEQEIGLGYSRNLAHRIDFTASMAYIAASIDNTEVTALDATGYGLGMGLRAMAGEKIELFGNLNYVDLDEGESQTIYKVGAGYALTEDLQFRVSYSDSDEAASYRFGFRVTF
jgi:hypothetical protein